MSSFSVKKFAEDALVTANGDDTATGDAGTDEEAPTLAEASPAEITAYYNKVFATQGDMKKLITEAADRIKNQRAPSVWGALSEGLAQPKTQPGISGTLANISSGLSEYRKGKTAFDEAQADKLMAYRLKELELGGSQAKSELELKYKLANLNKGSAVKLLPTKVVANNQTYSEAWNQIVPEGYVATNVGIMPTEQYRALTASGGRLPGAPTATPKAAPTSTPAPTTGAPLAAPGAPLAPTGAAVSSERPAVSLPENAKPGLPPGAYKGTDGKMYVNTRFGPQEVMGAAIDVTDLTRAQALDRGYFRGQKDPTGKYNFVEADRAPTPEELSRLNSGIAANIGKKTLVMGTLDKAMGDVTNMTASFGGLLLKDLPGPTRDQANRIRTIQANIGFDALQAMRDASKTGGALGQVAVQELNMLQASLGSLEQAQGVDELAYNLAQVKDHYQKAVEALKGSQYENEALRREILAAQGRPYTPKTPAKPAAAVNLNSFYKP